MTEIVLGGLAIRCDGCGAPGPTAAARRGKRGNAELLHQVASRVIREAKAAGWSRDFELRPGDRERGVRSGPPRDLCAGCQGAS